MLLLVELASAPRRTGLRVARRDALDLSLLRGKREKTLPDDECDMQNHAWTSGLFASLCQLADYTVHPHRPYTASLTRCIVTITLTWGASQIAGEFQTTDTAKCVVSHEAV